MAQERSTKIKHTITIDPSVLKELKHLAIELDQSYSEVIEQAIKEHLKKNQK